MNSEETDAEQERDLEDLEEVAGEDGAERAGAEGARAEDAGAEGAGAEGAGGTAAPRERSTVGMVAFATVRAAVVLVVAAVGYQYVIPVTHVDRSRLARLVISKSGVTAYDKATPQGAEQQASQAGLPALTTAAKKSPNQSGLYTIDWSPSQNAGAGVAAFLFPSPAEASTGMSQLVSRQLSASAYSTNGLQRRSTFKVASIPGSTGAVYATPKTSGQPQLAIVAFRYGRVVSIAEAFDVSGVAANVNTVASNQYAHLEQVAGSFSLKYRSYPLVATLLWALAAVALAAIAALTPPAWRWRRRRKQRRIEEELASRVIVGGKVIRKHRL